MGEELKPPRLAWTDARPTVPGWYWLRAGGRTWIDHVVDIARDYDVWGHRGFRLDRAGPIPEPDGPAPGAG